MIAQPVGPSLASDTATGSRRRVWRRTLLILGGIVLVFVFTYAFAWFRASSLSNAYLDDANASYEEGEYLQALTGYEEFDDATNRYITYGGYAKVARIWADPRAWPRPNNVAVAQQRIDEILNERITIEEAEGFIQANTGKQNPYLGLVFVRLGELYEEDGDERSAEDIFEEVPDLFPNEPDLIKRAEEHLQRLNQ